SLSFRREIPQISKETSARLVSKQDWHAVFSQLRRQLPIGNTNRKILLTTTKSFLHMNSVPAFLEIYCSGLVSIPLRPSEVSVGSNVARLLTFFRTRCMMT